MNKPDSSEHRRCPMATTSLLPGNPVGCFPASLFPFWLLERRVVPPVSGQPATWIGTQLTTPNRKPLLPVVKPSLDLGDYAIGHTVTLQGCTKRWSAMLRCKTWAGPLTTPHSSTATNSSPTASTIGVRHHLLRCECNDDCANREAQ